MLLVSTSPREPKICQAWELVNSRADRLATGFRAYGARNLALQMRLGSYRL